MSGVANQLEHRREMEETLHDVIPQSALLFMLLFQNVYLQQ